MMGIVIENHLYPCGRYVEFNLLYDRGTLVGLQSNGRTESFRMSLPPSIEFKYNWEPLPGSEEARVYARYLKPQNWLNISSNFDYYIIKNLIFYPIIELELHEFLKPHVEDV